LITNLDENIEVFGDEVIKMPMLKEVSGELIVECIDEQIADPTSTKINFLETFKENYDDDLEDANGDDDAVKEINDIARDFYCNVLDKINNKYHLGLDTDVVYATSGESLQNLADGLYQFFLVDYQENITTYISKMIIIMKDALAESIQKDKESENDVVTDVMTKKIKNASYGIILANINAAINLVKDMEMDIADFVKLFDEEYFPVAILRYTIKNNLVNGDFVQAFLDPFFNRIQDDVYDEIMLTIQQKIFEEYKREFNINENETITEEDIYKNDELINDEIEETV
jgi:hypothetical protein